MKRNRLFLTLLSILLLVVSACDVDDAWEETIFVTSLNASTLNGIQVTAATGNFTTLNVGSQASGNATIAALGAAVTFAHGLSAMPNNVVVGFKTDPGVVLNWYWTANTTSVNITVSPNTTNQLDFSWRALIGN